MAPQKRDTATFCSTKGFKSGLPCPNSSSSFWHSEPNAFLFGYQSSDSLPSEADVVIVGSGITGANAARFLSENAWAKDKKICLLEAREVCWGATGRNGGHCQPLLLNRDSEIGAFEIRNVEEVDSYVTQNKVPCEWRRVTACMTFWTENGMKDAEARVLSLRKTHPELGNTVRVVKADEKKTTFKECRVSQNAVGFTLTKGAATLWPYKLITFMIEKLVREKKISLYTHTPVTALDCSGSKCKLTTPRGTISAKHVVLASNGYTSHLLPEFGSLIVPYRCEMSALLPPRWSTLLPNSYGFEGNSGANTNHDDYLMQRPYYSASEPSKHKESGEFGGHLMFGGGRSFAEYPVLGQWEDNIIDQGEASHLRKELLHVLALDGETAGLKELVASHQWTGIKGYSRDHNPWVGPVPGKKGVWIVGGYTGHGMPNATLAGKAVVDMLVAQEQGKDLAAVQKQMVANAELPESYICTRERMDKALKLNPVELSDTIESTYADLTPEADVASNGNDSSRCSVI